MCLSARKSARAPHFTSRDDFSIEDAGSRHRARVPLFWPYRSSYGCGFTAKLHVFTTHGSMSTRHEELRRVCGSARMCRAVRQQMVWMLWMNLVSVPLTNKGAAFSVPHRQESKK